MDAFGNLASVVEPDPSFGNVTTSYTYDVMNHLTQVSMQRGSHTQTRTFNYTSSNVVGGFLLSATNPENGTVTYIYNSNNTLASKTDAKSQNFTYQYDSYNRLTSVTWTNPGDEVFGVARSSFAEYVTVPETRGVASKPPGITFEQAAAVPIAGLTALQSLRDKGQVRPGQHVLIHGASGGVGTFAVQLANSLGAEVAAVCSSRNVDLVRSLGASHVFDYTKEDFAAGGRQYDVLLDNVGNRSLSECRRVLKPRGVYVGNGGGGPDDMLWG
jgi:YD repeat-containing protein